MKAWDDEYKTIYEEQIARHPGAAIDRSIAGDLANALYHITTIPHRLSLTRWGWTVDPIERKEGKDTP